jgi:hypothetical protein
MIETMDLFATAIVQANPIIAALIGLASTVAGGLMNRPGKQPAPGPAPRPRPQFVLPGAMGALEDPRRRQGHADEWRLEALKDLRQMTPKGHPYNPFGPTGTV